MVAARTINIQPNASGIVSSLRGLGYSPEAALADLIDNSISANARNIRVDVQWNDGAPIVALLDDGTGMDADGLAKALRLGGDGPGLKRGDNDLGKFGMGLKTASLSQSRCLTIVTKVGDSICAASLDVCVVESNGWIALVPDRLPIHQLVYDLQGRSSGTVIIWDQIDELSALFGLQKEAFFLRLEDIRSHLGMVFHRFISGDANRLSIVLNGRPVKAWDPFQVAHPATTELPSERLRHGSSFFVVKPYVLPHRDRFTNEMEFNAAGGPNGWGARQGFYVYRGKRLVVAGSWLGLGGSHRWTRVESSRLARLQVDLPTALDREWRIDIRKSQATPPGALRDRLTAIASRCRAEAREVFAYRGKGPRVRARSETVPPIWLVTQSAVGLRYTINREHPIIVGFHESSGGRKILNAVLSIIERSVPVERIWLDVSESEGAEVPILNDKDIVQLTGQLAELCLSLPKSMTVGQRIDAVLSNFPGDISGLRASLTHHLGGNS